MTKEEIDKFCEACDKKLKKDKCLREDVCKDCKDFYKCVKFCIAEKRKEDG